MFPHVLPRVSRPWFALVAPSLIISLGSFLGRKDAPSDFEIRAGLFEGRRCAAEMLARLAARIDPVPPVFVMGTPERMAIVPTRTSP